MTHCTLDNEASITTKNAIYDAMFGQAWTDYIAVVDAMEPTLHESAREALKQMGHNFFDYAVADPARHQLMNQRTIPGFEPSPESYAPAVEVADRARAHFTNYGISGPEKFDLFTALISGLINAQLANDPGGDRWARLLGDAMDMFADHAGLPKSRRTP